MRCVDDSRLFMPLPSLCKSGHHGRTIFLLWVVEVSSFAGRIEVIENNMHSMYTHMYLPNMDLDFIGRIS